MDVVSPPEKETVQVVPAQTVPTQVVPAQVVPVQVLPEVAVSLSQKFAQILKNLIELDINEANKDKMQNGHPKDASSEVSPADDKSKEFIDLLTQLQAGIAMQAEGIEPTQLLVGEIKAGIPETLEEFENPNETSDYAKSYLENMEIVLKNVVAAHSRVAKTCEGLARMKDNLDPMQKVGKVAPEQFKQLVDTVVGVMEKNQTLKGDLTTLISHLTDCIGKLNDLLKNSSPAADSNGLSVTNGNGKIDSPVEVEPLAPLNGVSETSHVEGEKNHVDATPVEVKALPVAADQAKV